MYKIFNTRYVYILESEEGKFYTGMTWNIRLRIFRHNGLLWGGGKYTEPRRPWFLVHLERYSNGEEAHAREVEVKAMSHAEKKNLIDRASKQDILSAI